MIGSVPKGTELRLPKRLGEKVGQVFRSVDVGHGDSPVFHQLPHVEVPPSNVLRALVVLGVVGQIPRSLVVNP